MRKNLKKVIGINFMKGNYNYNNFYLINEYGFINKLNYGSIKDECLEMYMVRLDLIREKVYNYSDIRFIKWLKLINAKDMMEMKKISEGDEIMEQTLKFLEAYLADESNKGYGSLYDYDVEEAREEGERAGRKAGRKAGIKSEKIATAKNLINLGSNNDFIAKATGLKENIIEKLRIN